MSTPAFVPKFLRFSTSTFSHSCFGPIPTFGTPAFVHSNVFPLLRLGTKLPPFFILLQKMGSVQCLLGTLRESTRRTKSYGNTENKRWYMNNTDKCLNSEHFFKNNKNQRLHLSQTVLNYEYREFFNTYLHFLIDKC